MKSILPPLRVLLCLIAASASAWPSGRADNNGTTFVLGTARFQFLTPSLVRMEYSPSRKFVDAPTAIVLKRDRAPGPLQVENANGTLTVTTSSLTLRYVADTGRFSSSNLHVSWNDGGLNHVWSPGDTDRQNLGGIARSLDGANRGKFPSFQPGLLSKSGYVVLDDSRTPIWDITTQWIVPRTETTAQDLYIFVYGRDYPKVLQEYTALCGAIPMIPRSALGNWITDLNYEYLPGSDNVEKYRYTDAEIRKTVERFRQERIPLDVLVLDFAWHRFGWKGGYDWSPIFPNPREFLAWAHAQGLKVSLNDHPGYGGESVLSDEDSHAAEIRKLLNMPRPPAASFTLDMLANWKFRTDPRDSGIALGWSGNEVADSSWQSIQAGSTWEDQGHDSYDGLGWYRRHVRIPADAPQGPLYAVFGGVDDEYDLYVNGTRVAHHGTPGTSVYSTMTSTDISSVVRRGEDNLIVLRVNDWGGGGGITGSPAAIMDRLPGGGIRFNLADKSQATAFMDVLHNPLIDQGIDFWWIDGGSGCCTMDGLNSQMWTNHVYYISTETHTKKRALVFSRYGGPGGHRTPAYFTGDTYSNWDVLRYEIPFTARAGNVLVPYVTHDLGGFLGRKLDFRLYARWIEFGAFSPMFRLHCAHENPAEGNLRLPWVYGEQGVDLVRTMVRLRYRLLPYLYTYCRIAHDSGLPIVRPLYLEYPELAEAYAHPDEYLLGKELLVAPIVDSTDERDVYLPPGAWVDLFTGERHGGDLVMHVRVPVDRIPVFVRAGSIIPQQPVPEYVDQRPVDTLIADVYGPGRGSFDLYDDDGTSLDYASGKYSWTPLEFLPVGRSGHRLSIGPSNGDFKGMVTRKSASIKIHGLRAPRTVSFMAGGKKITGGQWEWDASTGVLSLSVPATPVHTRVDVQMR